MGDWEFIVGHYNYWIAIFLAMTGYISLLRAAT